MTPRKRSGLAVRLPLTELENDVMAVVWDKREASVEDVHALVSQKHKLKETSVRTLLRRLEAKGYLSHRAEGRSFIYGAVEPAGSLAARAVRQIVDRFCNGSIETLVAGMVDAEVLSASELRRLAKVVERYRK
ncbi:MAG TPA: BlaI/MecI/CopY family transcriptional regulator [Bryobacteraceae bacterium]|nr:BlaI/MecI/CopY family transcriptional regulator [Bryobacteraceae bacterium]